MLIRMWRSFMQVRFGVLNAGNFGVSQSRKRTFIWAAAPGEALPDWPKLLHIFKSPQLTINLPGNVKVRYLPIRPPSHTTLHTLSCDLKRRGEFLETWLPLVVLGHGTFWFAMHRSS